MRNHVILFIWVNVAAACGTQNREAGQVGKQKLPVQVAPIEGVAAKQSISLSGSLGTEDEARLSFKIAGIIEEVRVEEGQKVSRGQLLASLKSAEIEAQVTQAKLGLDKASRDYERALRLYQDSVVTLEQCQNARTALELARQTLRQVQFNQQYSKIYAPSDGFIARRVLQAGELAAPGAVVLVENNVSAESHWVLRAGLSDQEWSLIEPGDRAEISLDAFPGKNFAAVVSTKSQAADPATGSFQVELRVQVSGLQAASGMFGKALIHIRANSQGYRIPYNALLEADGRRGFVFVTNDRQYVRRVPVIIESINNNDVTISEGLQGYSSIVIAGSPYLQDGDSIQVINAPIK